MNRFLISCLLICVLGLDAQNIPEHLLNKPWTAKWISGQVDLQSYRVFKFRKIFEAQVPTLSFSGLY